VALWGLALFALWACSPLSTLSDFLLEVDKMITMDNLNLLTDSELIDAMAQIQDEIDKRKEIDKANRWANLYADLKDFLKDFGRIEIWDGDTGEVLATLDENILSPGAYPGGIKVFRT
jgi:hypothetical protein